MAHKTQTITKPAAKTVAKTAPKTTIKGAPKVSKAKAIAAELAAPAIAAANVEKAAKATAKAAANAATPAHAIIAMVVEGIAKRISAGSSYYATAIAYHKKAGTVFPRARNNETRAALKVEDVETVFDQHDKRILASGNSKGQAMFDVYMMAKS